MIHVSAKWALIFMIAATLGITGCASKKEDAPKPQAAKDYGLANALWSACQECNIETVRQLIDAGADLNASTGMHGTTALMETVRSYDNKCPAEMVAMLVEAGARINQQDKRGYTALHYSAQFNCGQAHIDATRALLENGADPGLLSKDMRTPLELATRARCADKVDLLVEHIKSYRMKLDSVIPDPTKQLITPAPKSQEPSGESLIKP